MASHRFDSQAELDAAIKSGAGWIYNRFYKRLHHVSCSSFHPAAWPSTANFRELLETWTDAEPYANAGCGMCRPGPHQKAASSDASKPAPQT